MTISGAADHDEDDEDDYDAEVARCERFLARHEPACVDAAIGDAYDHGVDTPEMAREAAVQFLEDGHSECLCNGGRAG